MSGAQVYFASYPKRTSGDRGAILPLIGDQSSPMMRNILKRDPDADAAQNDEPDEPSEQQWMHSPLPIVGAIPRVLPISAASTEVVGARYSRSLAHHQIEKPQRNRKHRQAV